MKTKLTISLVLLFLTVAFISKLPTAEEKSISYTQYQTGSSIPDNEFIIGALHNAYDQKNYYTNIKDTLHMNTWHKYTAPSGWGWLVCLTDSVDPADNWNGDTSKFGPNVRQSIQYNNTYGFRTIMDRPIIQYLTYGQRSDYQCEKIEGTSQDYWFYSYYNSVDNDSTINDTTDNSQFGDDQKVKLCLPSISSAGYIVKELKANREQANKNWNSWTNDDIYAWYIKPRIRVDPDFVDTNPNDTVCRIDIIDWNDSTIKKVEILGKNFLDEYFNYNGRYLDSFYFHHTLNEGALIVNPLFGDSICPGPKRDFWDWDNETIKTDFRVYWYGTCEMWIDYVRVENQPSVHLHSPEFAEAIQREVNWAMTGYNSNKPNNFYIDEFEFNITSSIGRVDSLIKAYSGNKLALIPALNLDRYKVHIPDCWDITLDEDDIKKYLIEPTGINYICYFPYPFDGYEYSNDPRYSRHSYHPNTLYSGSYDRYQGVLSYDTISAGYDNWLQKRLDDGLGGGDDYIYELKLHDNLTKLSGVDLTPINVPPFVPVRSSS